SLALLTAVMGLLVVAFRFWTRPSIGESPAPTRVEATAQGAHSAPPSAEAAVVPPPTPGSQPRVPLGDVAAPRVRSAPSSEQLKRRATHHRPAKISAQAKARRKKGSSLDLDSPGLPE